MSMCSGGQEFITFNPFNSSLKENTTLPWPDCIPHQDVWKYYNYSAGATATAVVQGHAYANCSCWSTFYVEGWQQITCDIPVSTTTITHLNGTTEEVYCEPSSKWCYSTTVLATMQYNCSATYEYCSNGCNDALSICNPLYTSTATSAIPAINQTEWDESGFGWATFMFSPVFLVTSLVGLISGGVARVGGMSVGGITALLLVLVLTTLGMYPAWLGVIALIIGAFIVAKFATGGGA